MTRWLAFLKPGNFMHFTVPSAQHEIVGYVSPMRSCTTGSCLRRARRSTFLSGSAIPPGMFMELIDEAQARTMMATFQMTDIEVKGKKAKMNYKDYYDKLYQ